MFKQLMCVLLLVGCVMGPAGAKQFCPDKSMIRNVKGYFQYQQDGVLWQGPKVEPNEYIHSFLGALFTPEKGTDRKNGYVEKCVYENQREELVVMRPCISGAANTMSLTDSLHWELGKIPFDQQVYVCRDNQPDNCAFTINDSQR
ncbi:MULTISPECIES: DUF3757 domain-containing protein [unclassified Pseudomonas]|uniref:DUF3757 domain-containing protein n=1 Tax=unclassified Pseudomonas TaxID=196821 RepID=UPI000F57B640|nr:MULTISPECIES: DUF3757 domain-containing protein [unclassified Pseudomonas]AZF14926.1 hypothetical protein C4J92_1427 [Pseudomonas sp. R3-18-08]AZF20234.1 hypothetical protein C4J91_1469 [Pseudomonas sp. R3-52-08]AZF25564.1 hypothetical protein C4J90_1376 [Pseudomonas sp. R2-60-08W]AZF30899.1 hypothetical protein C4J89_1409 [Pseudomonas sp. R4-35-07]AZF46733.1 hypothetical protein C4J86_1483 [Pseudomonas sp. R2-7-07]